MTMTMRSFLLSLLLAITLSSLLLPYVASLSLPRGVTPRFYTTKSVDKPKLVLIGGPPGTGKSTFGMSVALDQGIIKCISTDTIRAVMRSFVQEEISPALHRSSYAPAAEGDDPVRSWKETCTVLKASVEGLVEDSIHRGQSLVVEGVHVVPGRELIDIWEKAGGVAIGCILTITDKDAHISQLRRRGFLTGKVAPEEKKINSVDRIRAIQDEMIRRAEQSKWLCIEQHVGPDPLDLVSTRLWDEGCEIEVDTTLAAAHMSGVKLETPAMPEMNVQAPDGDEQAESKSKEPATKDEKPPLSSLLDS